MVGASLSATPCQSVVFGLLASLSVSLVAAIDVYAPSRRPESAIFSGVEPLLTSVSVSVSFVLG